MNAAIESSVPALPTAVPAKTPTLEEALSSVLKLSPADRLEVIARLAQSLQAARTEVDTTATTATLPSFVGAWASDLEADQMEAAIRTGRYFNEKPELQQWP
ncbi:hypothetical protein A0257_13615 [Hymenobacter psoromatis]|nr:hypothetical protein A0257_13615 [Hymenobacter psoromatis]